MSATLTVPYRRSIQEARRVAEAFRASTRGIDGKLLRERIATLAAKTLPEGPEGRHSAGYLAAITEVAASAPEENRADARAFAKSFVNRPAEYSRTKAGLAAIQLEAWIIETGGDLSRQFVETVLDSGDTKFLAIFESKLNDQDKDKLRTGTSGFVKMEAIAEAGAINYDSGEILEFSMFDCTAVGKQEKDILPASTDEPEEPGTAMGSRMRFESLLPATRAEYDRVYEQEGISRSVALYVIGARAVREAVIEDGRLVVTDANGVRWVSETGDQWVPDVDTLAAKDDEKDVEDEPEETSEARFYEVNDRTGAMRSFCNTWSAFTSPVLIESQTEDATCICAKGKATVVRRALAEVSELIERANDAYSDSPAEGDMFIEAALAEYAAEFGTPCVNESDVLALMEDVPDRPTRGDRDYDVRRIAAERMEDSTGPVDTYADGVYRVIQERVCARYPEANLRAVCANGTLVVTGLVSESAGLYIALGPFDEAGYALASRLVGRGTIGNGSSGWRPIRATLGELVEQLDGLVDKLAEADDEEQSDDEEPDQGGEPNPNPS